MTLDLPTPVANFFSTDTSDSEAVAQDDMQNLMSLIAQAGIEPEIGAVLSLDQAREGFRAMWEGRTRGKTVFTCR